MADTTMQKQWMKETCDNNVNREPFINNAIGVNNLMPTWTTIAYYTPIHLFTHQIFSILGNSVPHCG